MTAPASVNAWLEPRVSVFGSHQHERRTVTDGAADRNAEIDVEPAVAEGALIQDDPSGG